VTCEGHRGWLMVRPLAGVVLIAVIIYLLAVLGFEEREATGLVFYVSPQGDDTWSGKLPSQSARGTDGPFATLERARQAVREVISQNLTRDVRVVLRGGTYYLPEGFLLGPEDSGTADHSITYEAYPAEEVHLIGGMPIRNWSRYKGRIWQCEIPGGKEPLQLFENGWRVQMARTPKSGYYHIMGPVRGSERSAFRYVETDFDPEGWDISDGKVFIWQGHDWFSQEKNIKAIDREEHTVTMSSTSGYAMTSGNRYFIKNILSLLTLPGECQIAWSSGKIYCMPSHEPISSQTMVISTARNVIDVEGSWDNPVTNVHFKGLNLGISNEDVVRLANVENCSVRFCKVENGGTNGVLILNHAQRVVIYGNLIRYNGQHGVSLVGLPLGREDVNHDNVVENNHIHHCGRLVGHGYGVRIYQSGHNRIIHNEIHDMPRYGTTIKGLRYQVLRAQVRNVTWENHWDFLHSRNNLIAYNNIYRVNLDSQDTGAMESWGPGRDNVYDHNLIHDVGNFKFGLQSGMYLDDATDYFNVTNNIIYGVHGAGGDQCIFAKGIGNRIENNILVVAAGNSAAIRNMEMGGEKCQGHVYLRNIFYFESRDGDVYGFVNWNDSRVAASDYNVFWKPAGRLSVSGGPADGSFDKWLKTLDHKFDQHSINGDPMFTDPRQRDYHLQPGSPALKVGFKDIDTSGIGLEGDFPLRLRETFDELYRIPAGLVWKRDQ